MERKFWVCFYILIFGLCGLMLSLFYPYIESYAVSMRQSTAPGGEMLLWLVPFMAVFAIDTARQWRKTKLRKDK